MQSIFRAIKFIRKYLIRDTKYCLLYLFRLLQSEYKNDCKFYSDAELINLLKGGHSILRIGDGEIGLLHFMRICYQDYSDEIREDFLKIIKNYNEDSKYVLMIPRFVNYTNRELREFITSDMKKVNRFFCWIPSKLTYELIFNKKNKYFDSVIFYNDNQFSKLILPVLEDKKVIIVTNKNNVEKIKSSSFSDRVYGYLKCPQENAYELRGEIKNDIIELIDSSGLTKDSFVVLMSAGLSKTIIFDLADQGYQLLDVGKGLEAYIENKSLEYLI